MNRVVVDDLRADCSRCAALCCVVPAFSRGADFALDKPAETACPNLGADDRCGIHPVLRERGFPGCVVYDCFGAGQHVTQHVWPGLDRGDRAELHQVATVFPVVRALQELRWLVRAARALDLPGGLAGQLARADDELARRVAGDVEQLREEPVGAVRAQVNGLLTRASEHARRSVARPRDLRGADLVGGALAGADLRGASLRGAVLLGADLRRADLRLADLTGADLRGARLGGADLRGALFVTSAQLEAAVGDRVTRLDVGVPRPAHWTGGAP
ncbi:pentapeptide repeat-containing protein [Klenkia marina]|uniref:pentapeptide repeat-containing protein n=1 Tax=Klenkia marina TaxID=1960309 RepID=UPI001FB30F9D|nr:pentapeptide repeat-containing protein [Klenkia marina]